jgi:hypothetical protein
MIELREDQKDVVKRLVNALSSAPWVALQAPTGWGKTLVGLAVIKELGVKALWLTPRLSIGVHVFHHCGALGLKCLATAGREKLCSFGYSLLDFARGVCHRCGLNQSRVSIGELDRLILGSLDFGKVKEAAEQLRICPYKLQTLIEGMGDYDVVIAHYNRARKLVNALRPRLIIADEVHNTVIPMVHRVDARVLKFLLINKLGFEEDEAVELIRNPESLRAILRELVDTLIYVNEDELSPIVEEILNMLNAQIWYYDPNDEALVGLEIPELMNANAKVLMMSATLPPSLLQNAIIIKRGWLIPVRVDTRYSFTIENMRVKRDEMVRYVRSKFLKPSTLIFTTASREVLLGGVDEVVWEDDLGSKAPCDFRSGILALRTFGKFIEGVDLGCFENLVVLGYPILPPDAMRRLEARGVDERSLAVMKSIQLIGRVVRTATQPPQLPSITLADKRFLQIKDELQKYEIQAQLET